MANGTDLWNWLRCAKLTRSPLYSHSHLYTLNFQIDKREGQADSCTYWTGLSTEHVLTHTSNSLTAGNNAFSSGEPRTSSENIKLSQHWCLSQASHSKLLKADYSQSRSHINDPDRNYENQTPVLRKTAGLLCHFVPNSNIFVSLTPRLNPVLPSVDQMTLRSCSGISFGSLFQGCCRGVSRVWICGCICQTQCCCDSRVVDNVFL